jgi:CubicO group peptidase (beta-lactamase class C family)
VAAAACWPVRPWPLQALRAAPARGAEPLAARPEAARPSVVAAALAASQGVPGLRAVLVSQRGALVAERYFADTSADQLQAVNSVTKSVCALLMGQALRDGRLKSLDQTVAELLPDAVAQVPGSVVAQVSLGQILAGRTGQFFDPMRYRELVRAKPLLPFILRLPDSPVVPAGWSYNDPMVALLAAVLDRAYGGADIALLAQNQLFQPMGIEAFSWQRDRDGNPLAPGGLALRPRDLLKLAELMLGGGRWESQQLVPQSWVEACMRPQGPASWRLPPVADVGYGQLWFTGQLQGHRVAWAWGYGAQFAMVVPALQLCVATAASSPPPARLDEQTRAIMGVVAQLVSAAG